MYEAIKADLESAELPETLAAPISEISNELGINFRDVVGMLVEYSSSTWQCDDEYCCGEGWYVDIGDDHLTVQAPPSTREDDFRFDGDVLSEFEFQLTPWGGEGI